MSLFPGGKPEVSQYRHYSDVESEIQTGDLVCWRINKINSFFTFILYFYHKFFNATYSHVAIALRLGDHVFAVEATPKRVRMMPLYMLGNFYIYRLNIPYKRSNTNELLKHLGKPYSLFDMVKNMFSIESSRSDLYCSELGWDFYENIGFFQASVNEFDDSMSTPDELVKIVMTQTGSVAEFVKIDIGNIYHANEPSVA